RASIHAGRKIRLSYRDEQGRPSDRVIWPVAVGYMETARVVAAWCELRQDFRHFRTDRVADAEFLDDRYPARPATLRAEWRKSLTPRSKMARPGACAAGASPEGGGGPSF